MKKTRLSRELVARKFGHLLNEMWHVGRLKSKLSEKDANRLGNVLAYFAGDIDIVPECYEYADREWDDWKTAQRKKARVKKKALELEAKRKTLAKRKNK